LPKEARLHKYYMDGLFIKITGQYPYDQPGNFCPEQRMFIVYLFATLPSIESLNLSLVFSGRLQEIEEHDYIKEIPVDNSFRAIAIGMKKNETEYRAEMAEDMRREAIIKLYKEFNYKIPDNIRARYRLKKEEEKPETPKREPIKQGYDREKIRKMLSMK